MKALEYQVTDMSRQQLEQYCLELTLHYLLYQNAVQEMARDGWFGEKNATSQAGDPGF